VGEAEGGSRRREQVNGGGAAGEDAERGLVRIGLECSPGRRAIGPMLGGPRLLHHVGELVGEDMVTVLVVSTEPRGLVVVAVLAVLAEIDSAALKIDVLFSGEGLLAHRHLGAVGVDLDVVEAAAECPLHAIEGRRWESVVARSAIARGWGAAGRIGVELRVGGRVRRGNRRWRRLLRPQRGHGTRDLGGAG